MTGDNHDTCQQREREFDGVVVIVGGTEIRVGKVVKEELLRKR